MYFLGIDGGGTKTSFTLINENGEVLFNTIKGTCHPNQIGFDKLEILLREGLEEILNGASICRDDITQSFIGLAGYGKVEEMIKGIEKVTKRAFEGVNYILDSDVRVAIAGSLRGLDGINIISGTGSITLALKDKKLVVAGGWGASIGDEGSAYWIGKKSLEIFSKECDGRVEKGPLYNIFVNELLLNDNYDIIPYVNNTLKCDRGEIAKLARLCSMAAIEGDNAAIKIFEEAAKELSEMVIVLLKIFKDEKVPISYTGGVFKCGDLILKPLMDNLRGYNVKLVEPALSPDLGACLLAYIDSEYKVTDELIENMNSTNI
ncbi:MAG: BadF/BadG/BcrA/BcrD ATPase family protein [Clostridium sp.]